MDVENFERDFQISAPGGSYQDAYWSIKALLETFATKCNEKCFLQVQWKWKWNQKCFFIGAMKVKVQWKIFSAGQSFYNTEHQDCEQSAHNVIHLIKYVSGTFCTLQNQIVARWEELVEKPSGDCTSVYFNLHWFWRFWYLYNLYNFDILTSDLLEAPFRQMKSWRRKTHTIPQKYINITIKTL